MQVDWISGFVESRLWGQAGYQPYDTGHILVRERDGTIRRVGTGRVVHEGSFESSIMVSSSQGHNLYISGNPVKHIQGHNLFGSDDALGLFLDVGQRVRESVGLFPSPQTWEANDFRGPRFTRVDLTRSYRFESQQAAHAWLRSVAAVARSRHGAALLKGGTVYFGKGSERWTFKIYSKLDELMSRKKGHGLPTSFSPEVFDALMLWSVGVVRFELTLRSKELLTDSGESSWERDQVQLTPQTIRALWTHYYDRITWNRNAEVAMPDIVEEALTPRLRTALIAWRAGADLRAIHSKPTFYRLRQELLRAVGVDIAAQPVEESSSRASLDPAGWDPEPIETQLHRPDPALKKQYGLI